MKKYLILLFLFSALNLYAETVPEFKERVMRLGEYWETNDKPREVNQDITAYWAYNLEKARAYYKECGLADEGYMQVPYGSKLWNICAEIFAVSTYRDIATADKVLKDTMEKAIQYKEKQAYMKKVDKVGEYWDNNSALRPMTKEVIDYWWNRKPGTRLKASSYLRECQGTFDVGFEYFVVEAGSKDWNRCIEIWSTMNNMDPFEADKKFREQSIKAKKIEADYWKKVNAAGDYWKNNSALRPITKEVVDYWSSNKLGNRDKAEKYFDKCRGKLDTWEIYFTVQPGTKEWNRCIEIYCVFNSIRGNDVFNADKRMRETTKTIKEELKKMQQ